MAEFNQLCRLWILGLQTSERCIQGDKVVSEIWSSRISDVEGYASPISAMFLALLPPGGLHQNAPHGFGRGSKEMAAVFPARVICGSDKAQIGFMNERSCVKGVPRCFLRQPRRRQFAKFLVHQRQQLTRRPIVTTGDL